MTASSTRPSSARFWIAVALVAGALLVWGFWATLDRFLVPGAAVADAPARTARELAAAAKGFLTADVTETFVSSLPEAHGERRARARDRGDRRDDRADRRAPRASGIWCHSAGPPSACACRSPGAGTCRSTASGGCGSRGACSRRRPGTAALAAAGDPHRRHRAADRLGLVPLRRRRAAGAARARADAAARGPRAASRDCCRSAARPRVRLCRSRLALRPALAAGEPIRAVVVRFAGEADRAPDALGYERDD